MKFLSLNVQAGGGKRWPSIIEFVDKHQPDVAVFLEWRQSAVTGLAESWAYRSGFAWYAICEGNTRNGVAVAAKPPFRGLSATPGRESAGTMLHAAFDGWNLLACYFPQGQAKARYFDECSATALNLGASPLLIAGDLNTGNQAADKTLGGVKYACADRFDALSASAGLIDLWRRTHGLAAREWTWRTSKNGFRIDHAFGNLAFVQRFDPSCWYDHFPVASGLSDHSALVIDIGH